MFREKISRLEIYVTLEFEDGSAAGTLLRFRLSGKAAAAWRPFGLAREG